MRCITIARIENKVVIKAPVDLDYSIFDDPRQGVKWNLTVNEISEIESGRYSVKSNVRNFVTNRTESAKNEKISLKIEGGVFDAMGYELNASGARTEVIGWAEFDNESKRKMLEKAALTLLQSLKRCVEYIADGGEAGKYDKKKLTVSP